MHTGPKVKQVSSNCPRVRQMSAKCPPSVRGALRLALWLDRNSYCFNRIFLSINCPPDVHQLSARCPPRVRKVSTAPCDWLTGIAIVSIEFCCPPDVRQVSIICPQFVRGAEKKLKEGDTSSSSLDHNDFIRCDMCLSLVFKWGMWVSHQINKITI